MTKLNLLGAFVLLLIFMSCGGDANQNVDPTELNSNSAVQRTNVAEIDKINDKIAQEGITAGLLYARGKAYYDHEGYDQAIKDLDQAILLDSTQVDYYHLLADVYMDYFKSRQALSTMELAVFKFPGRIPSLLKLGEFQMILQKHNESVRTVDKILKIDPLNAEAFFLMGMNFRETLDTTRAIKSFTKAIENDPDLIDAWVSLGNIHAARYDPIAETYFNSALNIDPENSDLNFTRGNYFYRLGKIKEAKKDFMKVTRLDKQNSPAFFNIGLIYLEQDSIAKANQFFDFAVKTNPVYVVAYYYRGVSAEIAGNKEAAISDFKQVLQFEPDFKDTEERLEKLRNSG